MAADVLQTTEDAAGSLSFFSSAAVVEMVTTALAVSETETAAAAIPFSGSSFCFAAVAMEMESAVETVLAATTAVS